MVEITDICGIWYLSVLLTEIMFFLHPPSYSVPPAVFFHLSFTEAENKSLSASYNHAQFLCAGMLKLNDSFGMYRLFASWKEEVFLGLASSKRTVT